jgi:hypothetical protein
MTKRAGRRASHSTSRVIPSAVAHRDTFSRREVALTGTVDVTTITFVPQKATSESQKAISELWVMVHGSPSFPAGLTAEAGFRSHQGAPTT